MQMRTIRLLRSHTHAGRKYEPGAQLSLNDRTAAWLIDQGVAEAVGWTRERAALRVAPSEVRASDPTRTPEAKAATPALRRSCCGPNWVR